MKTSTGRGWSSWGRRRRSGRSPPLGLLLRFWKTTSRVGSLSVRPSSLILFLAFHAYFVASTPSNPSSPSSPGVMSGTQLLYAHLPFWLQIHLETPVAEEGGPAEFTFYEKLRDLRWVLKSLHSVGWAFERLSRPAPWLTREIEVIERREAEYWRRVAPGFASLGGEGTPGGGSGASTASPYVEGGEMSEADIEAMLTSMTAGLYEPSATGDGDEEPNPVLSMFAGVLS